MRNNLIAGAAPQDGGGITNPLFDSTYTQLIMSPTGGTTFLGMVIPRVVDLMFIAGAVIFFFMFLSGSVAWISSGGDKAKVESAKARITSSLVGLVIMLSTFAIVALVEIFFNINILSIDIGPLIIQ